MRRLSPQARTVLDALGVERDWLHGYELSRQTQVRPGTLYPLLERLAVRGLLEARWEENAPAGRPRRHAYRITADGDRVRATLREAPVGRRPVRRRSQSCQVRRDEDASWAMGVAGAPRLDRSGSR